MGAQYKDTLWHCRLHCSGNCSWRALLERSGHVGYWLCFVHAFMWVPTILRRTYWSLDGKSCSRRVYVFGALVGRNLQRGEILCFASSYRRPQATLYYQRTFGGPMDAKGCCRLRATQTSCSTPRTSTFRPLWGYVLAYRAGSPWRFWYLRRCASCWRRRCIQKQTHSDGCGG